MKKIKVAFIYKTSNPFMTGKHFDNSWYHFHVDALQRNPKINVVYFHGENTFDTSVLRNQFDIIYLWSNCTFGVPKELVGIEELDIPIISGVSDPVDAKESIKLHKKWKIDYYVHFADDDFFYELYPKSFKYKKIIFGVEPSLYQNLKPFNQRIQNRILLTGAIGNKKIISRMINDIKSPKWNAYRFYHLRTKCADLPYVDYTSTLQHEYVNDQYALLLQKYAATIAATTYTPNMKYWENSAAGCLTFMEISKKNRGMHLGYKDNETAIFIDEDNYQERFEEYLKEPKNPKWEKIAKKGQEYTLKNFNNDKAVETLVELMEKLVI